MIALASSDELHSILARLHAIGSTDAVLDLLKPGYQVLTVQPGVDETEDLNELGMDFPLF